MVRVGNTLIRDACVSKRDLARHSHHCGDFNRLHALICRFDFAQVRFALWCFFLFGLQFSLESLAFVYAGLRVKSKLAVFCGLIGSLPVFHWVEPSVNVR